MHTLLNYSHDIRTFVRRSAAQHRWKSTLLNTERVLSCVQCHYAITMAVNTRTAGVCSKKNARVVLLKRFQMQKTTSESLIRLFRSSNADLLVDLRRSLGASSAFNVPAVCSIYCTQIKNTAMHSNYFQLPTLLTAV